MRRLNTLITLSLFLWRFLPQYLDPLPVVFIVFIVSMADVQSTAHLIKLKKYINNQPTGLAHPWPTNSCENMLTVA